MLHADMELSAPDKTPFRCYLLALFQPANFLIINK